MAQRGLWRIILTSSVTAINVSKGDVLAFQSTIHTIEGNSSMKSNECMHSGVLGLKTGCLDYFGLCCPISTSYACLLGK